MDVIKMDDSRLDESFGLLFGFKKGDVVVIGNQPSLRGKISDGVYLGEFPKHIGDIKPTGRTLYEISFPEKPTYIVDEADITKVDAQPMG
jgi:hypothetical protein